MSNPVAEFLKEAGLWDAFKHGLSFGNAEELAKTVGQKLTGPQRVAHQAGRMTSQAGLGTGILAGATLAAKGGEGLVDAVTSGSRHRAEHEAMLSAHPTLQNEDPQEVEMVLKSIRNLSPSLSADPLVAGSIVRNILAYGRTEQGLTIPPETARMLADTQNKLTGNRGGDGAPSLLEAFGKGLTPQKGEGKGPVIQNFDPTITATQHDWYSPEGQHLGFQIDRHNRE